MKILTKLLFFIAAALLRCYRFEGPEIFPFAEEHMALKKQ